MQPYWPIRSEFCSSTPTSAHAPRTGQTEKTAQSHQTFSLLWGWGLGTRLGKGRSAKCPRERLKFQKVALLRLEQWCMRMALTGHNDRWVSNFVMDARSYFRLQTERGSEVAIWPDYSDSTTPPQHAIRFYKLCCLLTFSWHGSTDEKHSVCVQ